MIKGKFTVLIALIILSGINSIKAQERFFQAFGQSIFTDYIVGPLTKTAVEDPLNNTTSDIYEQVKGLSPYTIIYSLRFNLVDISTDKAISIGLSPSVGFGSIIGEKGSLNLPLLVGFDFGAGSTYNSTGNVGGFINVGAEYTLYPLTLLLKEPETDGIQGKVKTSWIQPVATTGIRYWNKSNKLREINLKYGFGLASTELPEESVKKLYSKSWSLRLSWLIFLNY